MVALGNNAVVYDVVLCLCLVLFVGALMIGDVMR